MKIRVREVIDGGDGDPRVRFDAAAGTGGGAWRSAIPPVAGRSYEVEFTLEPILDLDSNTAISERREPLLELDEDRVILNGVVETIDRERIGTLRLSPDAAVMLDFADPRVSRGDWLTVTVGLDECDLYVVGG